MANDLGPNGPNLVTNASRTSGARPSSEGRDTLNRVDAGEPVSKHFRLEHMSSGALHHILGKWIPLFPSKLNPTSKGLFSLGNGNINDLKNIFNSLKGGANNILDIAVDTLGGDMILRAGFMNNIKNTIEQGHNKGASFDLQLSGYTGNLYNVAKEFVQIPGSKASAMEIVYGQNQSWLHIDFNDKSLSRSYFDELPPIQTRDLVSGVVEKGITSIRGFL